jgi:3-oxoadipate enol-lactonase
MSSAPSSAALATVERGSGPAVVLVHGYPLNHEVWTPQLDALSNTNQVLAIDLPGYGGSAGVAVPETLSGFAEAVYATLRTRSSTPSVLVGHSFGGYILLELLRTHPEIARGVILANTRSEADTPEAREKRLATVRRLQEPGQSLDVEAIAKGLVAPATWNADGPVAKTVRTIVAGAPAPAVIGSLRAMAGRADLTPVLSKIRVPTLVVWGEEDQLIPTVQTRSMVARIPSSRGVGIPSAGHLPSLEAPDVFNLAVTELLDRLGTPA